MIASTISPTQPAQHTPSVGKADELATRRRAAEQAENRANENSEPRQNQAKAAQAQSPLEPLKPSVNTNGQAVGRVINTTA